MNVIGMNSWIRVGTVEVSRRSGEISPWSSDALPRGMALFFGAFGIVNVLASFHTGQFDGNLWWLDLRRLPVTAAKGFMLVSAFSLLAYGFRPGQGRWARAFIAGNVIALGIIAVLNAAKFYELLGRGEISSAFLIPFSLVLALALATIARAAWRGPGMHQRATRFCLGRMFWRISVVCLGCAIVFPLLQMFCFGKTDYRRPADIAVVLGARAYADGRPSDALADRVRTACQLYRQGLVRKMLFSGGPGDGAITEPEAMKPMAVNLGVNPADITLDTAGFNTQATVNNTHTLIPNSRAKVLVVSHFYHLPRVKLTYQCAGWEVFTVPAKETYVLRQTPYNIAREVAGLWVYYVKAITGYSAHR